MLHSFELIVQLKAQELLTSEARHLLGSGMQVSGEIHLGSRTILEYLLSPVRKAFHEAGRER